MKDDEDVNDNDDMNNSGSNTDNQDVSEEKVKDQNDTKCQMDESKTVVENEIKSKIKEEVVKRKSNKRCTRNVNIS